VILRAGHGALKGSVLLHLLSALSAGQVGGKRGKKKRINRSPPLRNFRERGLGVTRGLREKAVPKYITNTSFQKGDFQGHLALYKN